MKIFLYEISFILFMWYQVLKEEAFFLASVLSRRRGRGKDWKSKVSHNMDMFSIRDHFYAYVNTEENPFYFSYTTHFIQCTGTNL